MSTWTKYFDENFQLELKGKVDEPSSEVPVYNCYVKYPPGFDFEEKPALSLSDAVLETGSKIDVNQNERDNLYNYNAKISLDQTREVNIADDTVKDFVSSEKESNGFFRPESIEEKNINFSSSSASEPNFNYPFLWKIQRCDQKIPIMLLMHGAGNTSLTWCLSIESFTKLYKKYILIALDFRHHGNSDVFLSDEKRLVPEVHDQLLGDTKGNKKDLSAEILTEDILKFLRLICGEKSVTERGKSIKEKSENRETTGKKICLVGHSLGGSIATRVAHNILFDETCDVNCMVQGLIVIDMIEGTGLELLEQTEKIVGSIPHKFVSMEDSISFLMSNKLLQNSISASISVPAMLKESDDKGMGFQWRIHLSETAPFWFSWYTNLSALFLEISAVMNTLLITNDFERLDKPLMRANMEGKFTTVIIPQSSHAIHEDQYQETAKAWFRYLCRGEFISLEDMKLELPKIQKENHPNIIPSDLEG